MLFPKDMLIMTVCWLAISAQALSLPSTISGQPLPDKWFRIILDEPGDFGADQNLTRDANVDLVERTPITACDAIIIASSCINIVKELYNFCETVGTSIKSLSDQHSCRHINGEYQSIRWDFYASGRNCDTTAQQATIAGAIHKYIEKIENGVMCGTQCLRLDHGDTWKGWLRMGHASAYNDKAYCGPSLPFDSCVTGGNNDI